MRNTARHAAHALLLIVAIAWAAAGCRSQAPPEPQPGPVTRWKVEVKQMADPFAPQDEFNQPGVGNRYVAVGLAIANRSEATATIEPTQDFRLRTAGGITYAPAVIVGEPADISGGGEQLGRLGPGREITGILIFELPMGQRPAFLDFEDGLQPREFAAFPLG